jgi:hypothetical protein
MKKVITLISVLSLGFGSYASAQYIDGKDLPSNISEDFSYKYPNLSNVDWEKNGKHYKATFDVEKYAHEVVYDQTGKVLSQEFTLPVTNLPSDIFSGIKKNFPAVQLQEADQIVENGKISFKLNLKDENNETEKVIMTPDGRVIRTIIGED